MHLHWHRRDLRVADSVGLDRATETGRTVPVFVFDPEILEFGSPVRVAALLEALEALRANYRERGSDLVAPRGDPCEEIPRLADEYGADAVTWGEDYSGLAAERDAAVEHALDEAGVTARPVTDAVLHEPGSITTTAGEHYSVFSYYWKKWRDRAAPEPVEAPPADRLADVDGEPLPAAADLGFDDPDADLPSVTPDAARERLDRFLDGDVERYGDRRDYPADDATSRLSVHLKYGTIGIRTVHAATVDARERASERGDEAAAESVEAFREQLAWRDFYLQVLAANPETVTENFKSYERPIEWRNDEVEFDAWRRGETGYPIVDAGMRQLLAEGYVHNRVRMIVASFLTKDLLVDWRRGYAWFREHLVDHDPASDVGGWQWAASTGTDAQPYFRVFNPATQCERYDPDGEYVREYVPELREATAEEIHEWPDLSPTARERIAPEYPAPVVDHAERREAAIAAFERARGEPE